MGTIDPWGNTLISSYDKYVTDFHLEPFDQNMFPQANRLMRRGVVFCGIGLKEISECIRTKKPFYVLSGIMPTNDRIHLGNKAVVENIAYFQKHGGHAFILVADLEAQAARGISLDEGRHRALEFHIPAYVALGLDPKKTTFYFQSENLAVMRMAYVFATKVTQNEFEGIYGSTSPSRIMSSLTQVADILFPQFTKRMPGIIPVGPDQVPHILLSRDIVNKMRTEKYYAPSAMFHKYMPALNGDFKMSKSHPESVIDLPMDEKEFVKRIHKAVTGGRDTLEEQKRLGAVIEKDMVYELLRQHLIEDDDELKEIHDVYKKGGMTSGEIKKLAIEKMKTFMDDFAKKIIEARKIVPKLTFVNR